MKVALLLISLVSCAIADGDHHHHGDHHDSHHDQHHDTHGEQHAPSDQPIGNTLDLNTNFQVTGQAAAPAAETSSYSSYDGAAAPKFNDFKFTPTKKPLSASGPAKKPLSAPGPAKKPLSAPGPAKKPFPAKSPVPEKTESTDLFSKSTGLLNFAKDWDWLTIVAIVLVTLVTVPIILSLLVEIKTIKSTARDLDISSQIEEFIYNAQDVYEAIMKEY